jgi:hypothetical protein
MPDTSQCPTSRKRKCQAKSRANGANLGFEEKLGQTADKLRGLCGRRCYRPILARRRSDGALMPITAQDFVAKWRRADVSECSAVQQHFLDLCALVGHPPPAANDPTGHEIGCEMGADNSSSGGGWADVAKIGYFGH